VSELKILDLPAFSDVRGSFVKTFNNTNLLSHGITFSVQESYYSVSAKDVIRGMHFQLPPYDHAKIVFCASGAILDVALDLRMDSPTYGQTFSQLLSSENNKAFYIPHGFAHGFKALTEGAVTYYLVSGEYHQASDTGIAFDSIGFDWECKNPILSVRDTGFVSLKDFESPFLLGE
jgi:dTDP-4-dehydrorhamnose 3,5-epimerase/CDP-3, 6-dideoxy-D-glycero-D-glycero-4-hexulose-5-epimerase